LPKAKLASFFFFFEFLLRSKKFQEMSKVLLNLGDALVNKFTAFALPPELAPYMELAEEARDGGIDVSKLFRPSLKVKNQFKK
jgi:hypothetical protein